jgi:hypothetical protein
VPKVDPQKLAPKDLYGVEEIDNKLNMRERLHKRFRPHDTVQVKNIDDEELEWQWLSEDDESYVIDDSNIKIVSREMPGLWRLAPGETDILEGACAYIMMDVLFKKMSVKRVGVNEHPLDEREIRNFAFDDPQAQEHFIDRVYVGKMSPHAMQRAAIASLNGTSEDAQQKAGSTQS